MDGLSFCNKFVKNISAVLSKKSRWEIALNMLIWTLLSNLHLQAAPSFHGCEPIPSSSGHEPIHAAEVRFCMLATMNVDKLTGKAMGSFLCIPGPRQLQMESQLGWTNVWWGTSWQWTTHLPHQTWTLQQRFRWKGTKWNGDSAGR